MFMIGRLDHRFVLSELNIYFSFYDDIYIVIL